MSIQPYNFSQLLSNPANKYIVKDVIVYGTVAGYLATPPSYVDDRLGARAHTWAVIDTYVMRNASSNHLFYSTGRLLTPFFSGRLPKVGEFVKVGRFWPNKPIGGMNLNGRSGNALLINWSPVRDDTSSVQAWQFFPSAWDINIDDDVPVPSVIPHPDTKGLQPFSVNLEGLPLVDAHLQPLTTSSDTNWGAFLEGILQKNPTNINHTEVQGITPPTSGVDSEPSVPLTVDSLFTTPPTPTHLTQFQQSLDRNLSLLNQFQSTSHSLQPLSEHDLTWLDTIHTLLTNPDHDLLPLSRSLVDFYFLAESEDSVSTPQEILDNPTHLLQGANPAFQLITTPWYRHALILSWLANLSPASFRKLSRDTASRAPHNLLDHPFQCALYYDYSYSSALNLYRLSSTPSPATLSHWSFPALLVAHNYSTSSQGTLVPTRHLIKDTHPKDSLASFTDLLRKVSHLPLPYPATPPLNHILQAITTSQREAGLFITHNSHLIPTLAAQRELETYSTLSTLSTQPTGITQEDVQSAINDFQESHNFTLEPEQHRAVHLVMRKAGVMTGCAGSGKTTVANCMTQILEAANYNVVFAAPTGKAAQRLSESVGRKVQTLHSLFKINPFEGSSLTRQISTHPYEPESPTAFIFDEMAMSDSDLMYHIVKGTPGSLVYFLGDVQQLPPIGRGIPFKDVMSFLPTATLGVSKRSAAKSGVNYNCNLLTTGLQPLDPRPDFQIIDPKSDGNIPNLICQLTQQLLHSGTSPDEIQVLTPYATESKSWSYRSLNPLLQGILNISHPVIRTTRNEFRVGDRVVQTSNDYSRPRYSRTSATSFQQLSTAGIVNGEAGKVVGFVHSKSISLTPCEDVPDKVRDDTELVHESSWFMLVEVYDVELEQNVVLFYEVKTSSQGTLPTVVNESTPITTPVKAWSDDLNHVELAYALTIHKSQGSQYPVVITAVAASDNPKFVNRNMIYTAASRAQRSVIILSTSQKLMECRRQVEDGSGINTVLKSIM